MSAPMVNTYGLPSTTVVGQRLPKESFYKSFKLTAAQKREFVELIESLAIVSTIKEATVRIPPTKDVSEIAVVEVRLRGSEVPEAALGAVAAQHPLKLVYACLEPREGLDGGACRFALWRGGQLHSGPWAQVEDQALALSGEDLGAMWDGLCAQVVFGDSDGRRVDERLQVRARISQLTKELASVTKKHAKEVQPAKRNALFAQKRALERELAELKGKA